MNKKLKIFVYLFCTIAVVSLYLSTYVVTTFEFDKELLSTLPGCSASKNGLPIGRGYSPDEFEEMTKNSELCVKSKIEYIKTSGSSEGVSRSYTFSWK